MFSTFFFLELRYVLKQRMIYIFLALVTLLVFAAVVSDSVFIGNTMGNVYRNSPHTITIYITTLSIFGLFFAAAFFNNAALREHKYNFQEILYATPLSKPGYFFGKFFAATLLATIPLLGVFLGVYLGTWLGPAFDWMPADRFGDFYGKTIINNYVLFILPNMFLAGSIVFALSTRFKSTVISFVGVLLIIVLYIASDSFLSEMDNENIGGLLDAFGIRAYFLTSRYYTTAEMNLLSPSFEGILLKNRLLWIGVGGVILLLSYFSFTFAGKNKRVKKAKHKVRAKIPKFHRPKVHSVFIPKTNWIQLKSFYKVNFHSILKSVTFKILFVFCLILMITDLVYGFSYYGLKVYPVTYKLIGVIEGGASSIFMMIIIIFFSGELIWRDRQHRINEVIDATPHTSVISLVAKVLSLISVGVLLYMFLIGIGVVYQLLQGYTAVELDVYLLHFLYNDLSTVIVYSCLMILVQVLVSNKYLGYFISLLLVFVWEIMLSVLHIETNMLDIDGGPYLLYSDISGFGPGVKSALWFHLYWILIGVLWIFIAGSIWNRGVKSSLINRIRSLKKNNSKSFWIRFAGVGAVWLIVAGVVFYNTQILNTYDTGKEMERQWVAFEKQYKKYQNANLPKITGIDYFIDLYPKERDVQVKALMELENQSEQPQDSLHFVLRDDWKTKIMIPDAKRVYNDEALGYQIYVLEKPLQPGEKLDITITNEYITRGFENNAGNTSIVENGTFLNNRSVLPYYGYPEEMELSNPNKRKKYDLPPKKRMPELDRNNKKALMRNYLTDGRSDWIDVTTIISTSDDQIAIAPGSLEKEWQEAGRKYYRYRVDHPSQNFYSFISGRYEVAHRKWQDVDIEVYYDKKHEVNIEMMLDAVQRSLEYYTAHFGPYYHKQARIIEFPRYSTFAQAFPGTMPYSESFGFIANLEDESKNNVIDAVIAHEMAHQWWAHQVIGANMQGGVMLSESFAEYSSLMTMKHLSDDPMKMEEFIKYDLQDYLGGRSSEIQKELPLYKVENQGYIHYGKGSVVLYALQDYIGEEKMNKALKNFLEEYRYKDPPYPTSLDFLDQLDEQVPDSLKYIVKDWIKEITLYDLRMKEARYKELDNGKYKLDVKIHAEKIKADSLGGVENVPIDDWIDIGFFADSDRKKLQFQKRVKIDRPEMDFSFELDSLPAKAAIDPRRILIERIYDDNTKTIKKAD